MSLFPLRFSSVLLRGAAMGCLAMGLCLAGDGERIVAVAGSGEPDGPDLATPGLVPETSTVDLGEHAAWVEQTARFVLRNGGMAVVVLAKTRTSCGCAKAATSAERIDPGKEADVVVEMVENALRGPYAKHVFVHWREEGVDDGRNGVLRLTIRGNARPLLTVRPGEVVALGEVRVGEAVRRELVVEAGPAEVVLGRPKEGAGLSVETGDGRLAANGKMPLVVEFRSGKVGRFRHVLSLPVLSPKGHPPVSIVVHGTAVGGE